MLPSTNTISPSSPGNTEKLDLPSISQVQTRGPTDLPYYNAHAAQRPLYVSERLPSLPAPQHQPAYSSSSISSPRVSSISSAASSHSGSQSSYTSVASSNGPKTPGALSPSLPTGTPISGHSSQAAGSYDQYPVMNQGPAPDMYYQQHMSNGGAPPPQSVASHYPPQNPPLLQPGPGQYPPPSAYGQGYGYPNGLTSPPTGPPNVSTPMAGQNVLPLPGVGAQPGMAPASYQQPGGFDTTGQVAPAGMKPRVTATLWEDEGSLCFQVEARGICVARREGKQTSVKERQRERERVCVCVCGEMRKTGERERGRKRRGRERKCVAMMKPSSRSS